MAQSQVERVHLAGDNAAMEIAGKDICHEMLQYEKIIRFQDAIFSGRHPSIRLPSDLIASSQFPASPAHAPVPADSWKRRQENSQNFSANVQQPAVPSDSFSEPTVGSAAVAKPYGLGNTEINPVLLEKSDDLIKAELQVQRQRLERALREDVEQKRAAAKPSAQAEPLADFDLSDVLSKALTLVQTTAAATTVAAVAPAVDETISAANDAASDSFDDNTFYSSQHDTPESHLTSRVRNESPTSPTARAGVGSQSQNLNGPPTYGPVESQQGNPTSHPQRVYKSPPETSTIPGGYVTSSVTQVPGLNEPVNGGGASSGQSQNTSGAPSQSDDSANMEVDQPMSHYARQHRPHHLQSNTNSRPPSPLLRSHDLSPYAPQPAYVSQLAVSGRLPPSAEQLPYSSTGTPAQVAALRNEPNAATSPSSSPQVGKPSEKRKGKKKKRKAERQVPEADAIPYIKPEPRSPSPMAAPSYIRPSKRQRYSQRQPNEPLYEASSSRYDAQAVPLQAEPYPTVPPQSSRVPVAYERARVHPQPPTNSAVIDGPSYGREYVDDRRVAGDPYPHGQPVEYNVGAPSVPAGTPVRVDDPYRQSPRSYRETYEAPRMSVRPDGDGFMRPPPRQQPTRIVVDAYGREYIEPPRPAVVRHSAAPPVHHGESEIIYERAAPRALSRHPGTESYEEGGVIYRRPSPQYSFPRRVVTQPSYMAQDYRAAPHREYSTRPMAPSGEFVEAMAPVQRRHPEEAPIDYVAARASSVRPIESVRYEVPHEYGRVQSVRPEAAVRQYAANAHPQSLRETGQPYIRDYGGRLAEQPIPPQDYTSRPAERYYDQGVRGGEEIAFIERPRGATQEIVYADDARREIYR